MDRIYASGAAGSAPAAPASPSIGYPSAGNPGAGTQATKPGAYWYHMVMEELMAVILSAGITPEQGTLTQLATALQSGKLSSSSAGGTANAITANYTPAITALVDGMTLCVRAGSANATTTPTFTPNNGTIASKTIVKGNGQALVANDIAGAGHWLELQYDGALDKWVLLNPATGVNALGFGQSWQAVTRVAGTIYYNTTTKPIVLNATTGHGTAGTYTICTINGVAVSGNGDFGTTGSTSSAWIIPPGASYVLSASAGVLNVSSCVELR